MNRNPRPQVYFIKPVGQDGPVKIGHSAQVSQRLRELGKWSPLPLELVCAVDVPRVPTRWGMQSDSLELERRFHRRYADYRLHFEWFQPHEQMLTDIEALRSGTFDISSFAEIEAEAA